VGYGDDDALGARLDGLEVEAVFFVHVAAHGEGVFEFGAHCARSRRVGDCEVYFPVGDGLKYRDVIFSFLRLRRERGQLGSGLLRAPSWDIRTVV
jgi:hypothetical protein